MERTLSCLSIAIIKDNFIFHFCIDNFAPRTALTLMSKFHFYLRSNIRDIRLILPFAGVNGLKTDLHVGLVVTLP